MRGLMLLFGSAFMGIDLHARVFDTIQEARDHFEEKFEIEYDTYVSICRKLSEQDDLLPFEQEIVENAEDMFWPEDAYSNRIDTDQEPIQQVAIFEVGKDSSVMVLGQSTFM